MRLTGELREALDALPQGVVIWDCREGGIGDAVFSLVNRAANEQSGVDLSPMQGSTMAEAFPPLVDTPLARAVYAVARGELPSHSEELLYGDARIAENWFRCHVHPFKKGLAIVVYSRISAEVTARHERDRTHRELRQFAYVASHDLKEPIRMVTSWMEILVEDHPHLEEELATRYVREGARRMEAIVDGLLSLSRIQTVALNLQAVDLEPVLQRIARSTGGSVAWELRQGRVQADPALLRDALSELIDNALKFARGKPQVVVRSSNQGDWTVIEVEDRGIGIDPQYLAEVVRPFRRLGRRDEYPGNGIGLGVVNAVAERHGGRLEVSSSLGEGSCFRLILPAAA